MRDLRILNNLRPHGRRQARISDNNARLQLVNRPVSHSILAASLVQRFAIAPIHHSILLSIPPSRGGGGGGGAETPEG